MTDAPAPSAGELRATEHLLSAAAVHERAAALFSLIEEGRSDHFAFRPEAMDTIADAVADLTRSRFPDLRVPLHSRWRHFEAGGHDRFDSLAAARDWRREADEARAMGDLAIVSVLLDAGAGPRWRYHEAATGETYARSEGLAVASFAMFASGVFSAVPADPLRVDAQALESLGAEEFFAGLQISKDNPLEGAEGRLAVLNRCAAAMRANFDWFASEDDPRPGGLVDTLAAEADDGMLPAATILYFVLAGLGPVWPSRVSIAGIDLGDTWRHPALGDGSPGSDLIPFHKLSTWLALSLIEPLATAGIRVTGLDELPGLAEYRNGGLFVDGGALALRDPRAGARAHPVDDPLVVEWRAATVTLLGRLAPMVRDRLGVAPAELPLAAILEGGTWLAGRRMAAARRADGGPPITVVSDGTVF